MTVQVAERGGFCFGVRRAVDSVLEATERFSPLYTLGPIIHNPAVVDMLEGRGAHVAYSVEEIPENATVVIRSHGVGPEVLEKLQTRGVRVIDATCPFVARIQQKVRQAFEAGMQVVLVGEPQHPEVQGINGWCHGTARIVQSAEDVEALPSMERVCVAAQTTTNRERWETLLALIQARFPGCEVFPSICSATFERQKEAVEIAEKADIMLVIGGRNSSNTQKLFTLCSARCPRTYLIESPEELPGNIPYRDVHVGITTGASTPAWIIKEVITRMCDIEKNEILTPETETETPEVKAEAPVAENPTTPAPAAEAEEQTTDADTVQSIPSTGEGEANFVEDFEKMMMPIRPGQIIKGKVVSVNDNEVCVNIGYKADGFIQRSEFSAGEDVNPRDVIKEGDEIEVEVLKVNDGEGNVLLSKKNVDSRKYWKDLVAAYNAGEHFTAVGKQAVKGGIIASINGIRAFIPASHLDTHYVEDINSYIGKPMEVVIIEMEKGRKRVVASHKNAILENEKRKKAEKWASIEEGTRVMGIVRRLTDFGAFVDIGGVDGLVHVTNLAWGRVQHPRDVVNVGDEIEVLIMKVDRENERISLGYKQLKPKPWDVATSKYIPGTIVTGKVVRLVSFGAFVELEPGLDGLVHISQIADHRIDKVESVLQPGQIVDVKILDVNPEEHRISLSIRDALVPKSENDYSPDDYEDSYDDADDDIYEVGDDIDPLA